MAEAVLVRCTRALDRRRLRSRLRRPLRVRSGGSVRAVARQRPLRQAPQRLHECRPLVILAQRRGLESRSDPPLRLAAAITDRHLRSGLLDWLQVAAAAVDRSPTLRRPTVEVGLFPPAPSAPPNRRRERRRGDVRRMAARWIRHQVSLLLEPSPRHWARRWGCLQQAAEAPPLPLFRLCRARGRTAKLVPPTFPRPRCLPYLAAAALALVQEPLGSRPFGRRLWQGFVASQRREPQAEPCFQSSTAWRDCTRQESCQRLQSLALSSHC